MSRHVVLVHRYFEPDTPPYATILGAVARHLGERDFRVTVLTCQPSYNRDVVSRAPAREAWGPGVQIIRWPVLDDRSSSALKVVNLIWFCLRLLITLPRLGKVHVAMAASTPPVIVAGLVSLLARRMGAHFVYHKQDIYPEVTVGLGRRIGVLAGILRAIDTRTDIRASRVVVLSDDMARTTEDRGVSRGQVCVINNFDPWQLANPAATKPIHKEALTVVFAGNLGRFQGLEVFFDAMVQLRSDPVLFHFFGSGALSAELERLVADSDLDKVKIHGYCPPEEVAEFLAASADVGIVSLARGVIGAAYPSKTLSYLRQGTPILALVESDSELATMVRDQRIGEQVEPGNLNQLVAALRRLAENPSLLDGAPQRARELYASEFSPDSRLRAWTRLFDELANDQH